MTFKEYIAVFSFLMLALISNSCSPSSPGFVIKQVESKLPLYRLEMKGSGESPPFNFEGFLSHDPPVLTYFLFNGSDQAQQYAASWDGNQWQHFRVSEETHSEMLRSLNYFKSSNDYAFVRDRGGVADGGKLVLDGKMFRFTYPVAWYRLYSRSDGYGKELEALFLVAFSFTGNGSPSASWFARPLQAAVEVFSMPTGERLLFVDALGNVIYTDFQMTDPYHNNYPRFQMPYLLWQSSVKEAFAIDLRSLIPRKK